MPSPIISGLQGGMQMKTLGRHVTYVKLIAKKFGAGVQFENHKTYKNHSAENVGISVQFENHETLEPPVM